MNKKDPAKILNNRFGKLIVINSGPRIGVGKKSAWICLCDCGKESNVRQDHLLSGKIQSCGCGTVHPTHGMTRTKVYRTWQGMLQRCSDNIQGRARMYYYDKGIRTADHWKSFENFFADMGHPPTKHHTIYRINGALGYSKENCRWATRTEQNNNLTIKLHDCNGEKISIIDAAKKYGINLRTIRTRMNRNELTLEDAINFKRGTF